MPAGSARRYSAITRRWCSDGRSRYPRCTKTLSMNTLSDDGGWIGDDLLAELASQSVQDAVLGFQYPRLVLSHTSLDEVEAFDHHAPEECGWFSRKGLVRHQAAAPCRHAPVKAA